MALKQVAFDNVNETHFSALIAAGVAENRDIEYKAATYGNADADYAELLADASSFANTVGGDLLIGIKASQGVPKGLSPFPGDADAEVLRLESALRSGLQPRIAICGQRLPY
jgi:predicted HTH transcriptional regulator